MLKPKLLNTYVNSFKKTEDNNYSLKQLKDKHIKVQAYTTKIYSKIVLALKEKNVDFYTYQLKKDRSYKAVLRGIHQKTNTNDIISELKKGKTSSKTDQ